MAQVREPLAVVGLAYRFPGSASTDHKLWDMLAKGRSAWSKIPKSRFNHDAYYHPDPSRVGVISAKGGYFLDEDPAVFDAPFFGISAAEASALDPQQRYLLETTFECLENAGIPLGKIRGSKTGYFAGAFLKDYDIISGADILDVPTYAAIGGSLSFLSNRASWFYDLKGPSLTLDTACSSSLVAFHLACQSVWNGESDQAFAAGANMILMPNIMRALTQLQFLSPDGVCHSFDQRANGYARGEGFAVLMVKPVRAAIRDGDCIRAIVRGSATNQNGRTPGITMPSTEAQAALIRTAYESSGLDVNTTGYFEAHGTGTPIGDPMEFNAIAQTLIGEERKFPLIVGSVKSNIGHLEGTAGLAGLVKAILCVEKGLIPPVADLETPNPKLRLDDANLQLATELMEWPSTGIRRASVNSFGAGGSNAHVVIDDAVSFLQSEGLAGFHRTSTAPSASVSDSGHGRSGSEEEDEDTSYKQQGPPRLFVFSAPEQAATQRMASVYATHLEKHIDFFQTDESGDLEEPLDLQQLADTLGTRRSDFEWKTFAVASSVKELHGVLARGLPKFPLQSKTRGIAFVFTGQGAQSSRMGIKLLKHRVYADHIRDADAFLSSIGSPWSVTEELNRDEQSTLVNDARYSQPLCTIVQTGLVDLLASWGIAPKSVVGHSSGEIAAAYACGALTKEQAWRMAYFRGLWSATITTPGGMLAVGLGEQEATEYLSRVGANGVVIACINSPGSTTLSGPAASIAEIREKLASEKIYATVLRVPVAYHSPSMEEIAGNYFASIADVTPSSNTTAAMYSSVTGSLIKPTALGAQYWVENMLNPVKFTSAVGSLLQGTSRVRGNRKAKFDVDTFLEIGPHGSLQEPLKQIANLDEKEQAQLSFISMLHRNKDANEAAFDAIGRLWTRGHPVDLSQVNKAERGYLPQGPMTQLPHYPWNHGDKNRHWYEGHLVRCRRSPKEGRADLLGFLEDDNPATPQYRNYLKIEEAPWLADHDIQGMVVFPASGFISMAIEAALRSVDERKTASRIELRDVIVQRPLLFQDPSKSVETRLAVRPHKTGTRLSSAPWTSVTISSRSVLDGSWVEHSSCLFMIHYQTDVSEVEGRSEVLREAKHWQDQYNQCKQECNVESSPSTIYSAITKHGFNYGPLFRNLTSMFSARLTATGKITIPDTAKTMPKEFEFPHVIHPITLDNAFQLVIPALRDTGINSTMLPTAMESIVVDLDIPSKAGTELLGFVKTKLQGSSATISTIVLSEGEFEKPLVTIQGLYCQEVAGIMNLKKVTVDQAKHIASEIQWREDVHLLSGSELGNVLGSPATIEQQRDTQATNDGHLSELSSWVVEIADLQAFKNPTLRVLELQNDGPELATAIIDRLSERGQPLRIEKYHLAGTQPKPSWVVELQKTKGETIEYHQLDMCDSQEGLFLEKGTLDLVTFSGVPGVTTISVAASHAYAMLKAGGRVSVVLPEVSTEAVCDQICNVFGQAGFNSADVTTKRSGESGMLISLSKPQVVSDAIRGKILLVEPNLLDSGVLALMANLEKALKDCGYAVRRSTLQHAPDTKESIVISCLDLGAPMLNDISAPEFASWQRIVLENTGFLWLSVGAQSECSKNPLRGIATGVFRVARAESPHLRMIHFDLSEKCSMEASATSQMVLDVLERTVLAASDDVPEPELKEESGKILIPRVMTHDDANAAFHYEDNEATATKQPLGSSSEDLYLTVGSPGMLDTLRFVSNHLPKELPKGSAKVKVTATPINFVDIMVAMGMVPAFGIGCECAGIISEAADGGRFKVGDEVVVLTGKSFANYVIEDESMMQPVPKGMSAAVAASCATIYVTAYVALVEVARIQKGETALIHAGAGGLGQAAIQLCRMIGAEVYATVGSVTKKALLMEKYGIAEDHIFNSRDLSFAKGIARATDNRGVDVILNSTAGEALRQTWHCIAPFGRFLEVGKRDIMMNTGLDMTPFLRNVTYAGVHIDQMVGPSKTRVAKAFADCFELLSSEKVRPVYPTTIMTYSEMEEAFRMVQQGKHSGKVVLTASDDDIVPIIPKTTDKLVLRPDVTYAIGGGLGGIGRSLCDLMFNHGARHFAFFSRSGDSRPEAKAFLEALHARGADARAFKADLGSMESLSRAIGELNQQMPPVAGLINSAMNLQDALFEKMTHDQWVNSLSPKVNGSWNFHKLLPENLDFFIMLSSIAAITGSPGQSNYAGANGYQDRLAHYRRSIGQHGTSINLSAIFGVGHIEENSKDDQLRMKLFEMVAMDEQELQVVVSSAIKGTTITGSPMPAQLVTGVNPAVLNVPHLGWAEDPKFNIIKRKGQVCSVGGDDAAAKSKLIDELASCTSLAEAAKAVEASMVSKLAASMMVQPEDIDTQKPLHSFGVDSLVAVEVRNWIFKELKSEVTVFDLMDPQPVSDLVYKVVERSKLISDELKEKAKEEEA